ncbi:MAG: hypothetical protein ACHRXM_33015, partial [Isosphaerales bacterium]
SQGGEKHHRPAGSAQQKGLSTCARSGPENTNFSSAQACPLLLILSTLASRVRQKRTRTRPAWSLTCCRSSSELRELNGKAEDSGKAMVDSGVMWDTIKRSMHRFFARAGYFSTNGFAILTNADFGSSGAFFSDPPGQTSERRGFSQRFFQRFPHRPATETAASANLHRAGRPGAARPYLPS